MQYINLAWYREGVERPSVGAAIVVRQPCWSSAIRRLQNGRDEGEGGGLGQCSEAGHTLRESFSSGLRSCRQPQTLSLMLQVILNNSTFLLCCNNTATIKVL